MAEVAKESGHFYLPDSTPFYTCKSKDGTERATTLRDARKVGAYPSVTTILRCAAAPGLVNWQIDMALNAALTLPRLPDEPLDAFKARALQDSQEQGKRARERGSSFHGDIEIYLSRGLLPVVQKDAALILSIIDSCKAHLGQDWQDLSAERSFASTLGYGGKVDLHGRRFVLDFKTTDRLKPDQKQWPEQLQQLVAYREGLGLPPGSRLLNVYIGLEDGQVRIIENDDTEEQERAWECFKCLLGYYRAKTGYYP